MEIWPRKVEVESVRLYLPKEIFSISKPCQIKKLLFYELVRAFYISLRIAVSWPDVDMVGPVPFLYHLNKWICFYSPGLAAKL